MSMGPDPALSAQAQEVWGENRSSARKRHNTGGKWSSLTVELEPLRGFYSIVSKLAERAKARGEIGEGGAPVWSIPEWQRFIRAAREGLHLETQFSGLLKTVVAVETLIDADKTAVEIHRALYWASRKDDQEQEVKAKAERDEAERNKLRARELAVQAEMDIQRVRIEARERLKSEKEASYAHTPGRVAV